jgi:hypothetical protein
MYSSLRHIVPLKVYPVVYIEYGKQDQQGKAAFNERNPNNTQQQGPEARSPGGPQTK